MWNNRCSFFVTFCSQKASSSHFLSTFLSVWKSACTFLQSEWLNKCFKMQIKFHEYRDIFEREWDKVGKYAVKEQHEWLNSIKSLFSFRVKCNQSVWSMWDYMHPITIFMCEDFFNNFFLSPTTSFIVWMSHFDVAISISGLDGTSWRHSHHIPTKHMWLFTFLEYVQVS